MVQRGCSRLLGFFFSFIPKMFGHAKFFDHKMDKGCNIVDVGTFRSGGNSSSSNGCSYNIFKAFSPNVVKRIFSKH